MRSTIPLSQLITLYHAGYSLRQISVKVNRSHQGIAIRLRNAGFSLRPQGEHAARDKDWWLQYRASQQSTEEHQNGE